jgi:NitT/TauT family transport system ATP-binding protein
LSIRTERLRRSTWVAPTEFVNATAANGYGTRATAPKGIDIRDLSVRYAGGRGQAGTYALDAVSFRVEPSEFVAIVGPSGCGKSTLLKAIGGLIAPSAGVVTFDGSATASDERIGFLFQSDALFPWKTALENVEVAVRLGGGEKRRSREIGTNLMTELGLGDACKKYPHELSGGMRKRVALARTLAYEPSVFLMDEPFGALDAQTRVTVGNFFLSILERSKQSVLFVTHDIEEAVTLADRVIALSAGPGSHISDEVEIDLPRPRDYYESRFHPSAVDYQRRLWDAIGYGKGTDK